MHKLDDAAQGGVFDYGAEAELFSIKHRKSRRLPEYKRFECAGDAIRFAIETLAPQFLLSTYLEVDEVRFAGGEIRRLYDSADYPLARAAAGTHR